MQVIQRFPFYYFSENFDPGSAKYNADKTTPIPSSPRQHIEYNISKPGYVSLMVYDVTGKKIAGLIRNEFQSAGKHCYVLEGREW